MHIRTGAHKIVRPTSVGVGGHALVKAPLQACGGLQPLHPPLPLCRSMLLQGSGSIAALGCLALIPLRVILTKMTALREPCSVQRHSTAYPAAAERAKGECLNCVKESTIEPLHAALICSILNS